MSTSPAAARESGSMMAMQGVMVAGRFRDSAAKMERNVKKVFKIFAESK